MSGNVRLGIDFGTSHTVAVLRDGETATPLIFDGTPLLPSAVYATEDGRFRMGRDALHSARLDPARFEPNPKRRVDDGTVLLGDNELDVVTVFAAVLERVRDECVRVAGSIPLTTFTHPATWGSARRMVLEDAAVAAGFTEVRMRAEPVAAAMYFARQTEVDLPVGSAVVVFDFGGGTFDVSVVRRGSGEFEVLSVDGVEDLGGVDIDYRLVEHLGGQFPDAPEWGRLVQPTTPEDRRFHRTFVDDVRSAKEQLSRHTGADLLIPLLNRETHLTRDELEQVTGPLLERALRVTTGVIRAARLQREQVAGVFLVGGASRMPLVATLLHRHTGIAPTVIDQPELVVAHGATLESSQQSTPSVPTPPPQRKAVAASVKSPVPSSAVLPEHQRIRLPRRLGQVPTSATPSPPFPAPNRPAGMAEVPSMQSLSSSRLSSSTVEPDRPPWTLRVAQIVLWLEVVLVIWGPSLAQPSYFDDAVPWIGMMLVLTITCATLVTIPRRGLWQGWAAIGIQLLGIGISYVTVIGGLNGDVPQTYGASYLLGGTSLTLPLLIASMPWFAQTPAQPVVARVQLAKLLVGAQLGSLVFTGIFPVMAVGTSNYWATDFGLPALVLHITMLSAAAIVLIGLNMLPRRSWGRRGALVTQWLMVGMTLVSMLLMQGDEAAMPVAGAVSLSVLIIPLVIASRRFYPELIELDLEPR